MSQTVVALFENQTESQKAMQELMKIGLPQDRVDVSKGYMPKDGNGTPRSEEDKDSISEFFDSLFGDSVDSKRLSEVARTCGFIVTVHANSTEEARNAARVLDQAGAADLEELEKMCGASAAAQHKEKLTQTGQHQQTAGAQQKDMTGGTSIPIIKENVEIGKREVESGGVRVRSRIVERPVEEKLRLREEHIKVERNQVNRPASAADFKAFKQGDAEFIEHKEVPIVNKEAKVVEEVRIGKEVDSRQETIRETEKKTEVDVQQINRERGDNTPNNANKR